MDYVFEITDKTKRKIHLSEERWNHILKHTDITINNLEDIKTTLISPASIILQALDESKSNYYLYMKERKSYLLVGVKHQKSLDFYVLLD